MDENPINHDAVLRELEKITGIKTLHIDTATTGRWYQHLDGEVVLGERALGLHATILIFLTGLRYCQMIKPMMTFSHIKWQIGWKKYLMKRH